MWQIMAACLGRNIAVQFPVNNFQLMPGHHRRIFIILSHCVVIEKIFAPVIRADQGKIFPFDIYFFSQSPLLWSDCAFARCRRAFCIHHNGVRLRRQEPIAFAGNRLIENRPDNPTNFTAAKAVHHQTQAKLNNKIAIGDKPSMLANDSANNSD